MSPDPPSLQDFVDVLSSSNATFWDGYATGGQAQDLQARVALASPETGALGVILFPDRNTGLWAVADGLTATVDGSENTLTGIGGVRLALKFTGSQASGTLSLPYAKASGAPAGRLDFPVLLHKVTGAPGPPRYMGGRLHPVVPARVLDTRVGTGAKGPLTGGETLRLPVLGAGGVPASGVAAVVLNVTVTRPAAGGYLTVWPDGVARPTASNVNFSAGQTVPNLVISPVGADGKVNIYNGSKGSTQVLADVSGWFASGDPAEGGLHPVVPARVLDTRVGTGAKGPLTGGETLRLPVLGAGGVPASGVAAVVLNVTVTRPAAGGYLTVWPDGVARPTASNVNFSAGQTVPNLVISPVGADGKVNIYNGSKGSTQVLADVSGWFAK